MKTTAILAIITFTLICGCAKPTPELNLPYADDTEEDEYSVYSQSIEYVYMRNLLSHNKREIKSIIIIAQTNPLNEYWRDDFIEELDNEGVSDEVIEDWRKKNESTIPLQRKFDFKYEYQLVTRDDLDKYPTGTFFTEFYKKYPDSNGLISVSRIGYDEMRTTALIHVIHSYGTLGAQYYYLVLNNRVDGWEIVRRISTR